MINSIKFINQYRTFKKNEVFSLKPITLLVGDQGIGKSSFLEAIIDDKIVLRTPDYKGEYSKLDLEKDNPRIKNYLMDNPGFQIASKFLSHGQTLLPILESMKIFKNQLILLDEPETALSIKNQYKISRILKNSLKKIIK